MNIARRFYCRAFQFLIFTVRPLLPSRNPKLLDGMHEIPNLLKEKKQNSILLVTDENLRKLGVTKSLEDSLKQEDIACHIYDRVLPNPTTRQVEECCDVYRKGNCKAIIAFGGGSPMDCAKATAARIARPHRSLQKMKGLFKVMRPLPLLIAVPTTAGSGSETTLSAVITDGESHHKYVINDFVLVPQYVVLDPAVTASLPKDIIATTGMDALTHALEAYIGKSSTKKSDADACEAIRLICGNLKKAYDTNDEEARRNMLLASHLAGRAFSRAYVGYVHALAHALGGAYNIPHGLANAVLLPNVLEAYGKTIEHRLASMAKTFGYDSNSDFGRTGGIILGIRKMNDHFGIPEYIKELREEDIPRLAGLADAEANPLYPVPKLWNAKELESIYYSVLKPNL